MLAAISNPGRAVRVVPADDLSDPVRGVPDQTSDLRDAVAPGDQPKQVPMRAFHGVVCVAVPVAKLVRREMRGNSGDAGHDRDS